MVTISSIQYRDDFLQVLCDTGEAFRIPYGVSGMFQLEAGKVVDHLEYQQLKEESDRFTCRRKAYDYLAVRNRSARELEIALSRKGFSKDIIREVLIDLEERGYVNDYQYAIQFIRNKRRAKTVGDNLLRAELQKRGVDRKLVTKAIRKSEKDQPNLDDIYTIALKKALRVKTKKNPYGKVVQYLGQRGFEFDEIQKIMRRLKGDGLFDNDSQDSY
ncbi:MAG TPA: RecX family transcriptional regulator [Spirochaetota bacterium]|nr:RecX family transcriptional regulator [Spirochaetota bacterium]